MSDETRPEDCPHERFHADVEVARLLDRGKFVAEITVHCMDCRSPFRFIGIPAGMRFDGPTVSIDEPGRKSGYIYGAPDADVDGSGDLTDRVDCCSRCYREFVVWMKARPVRKGRLARS